MMKKMLALLSLMLLLSALPLATQGQDRQTLTVFAAAALTDAFTDIGVAFSVENPQAEVIFSFDNSSNLAAQILEGAPADVFASANLRQMQRVKAAGLLAEPPRLFVRNRLALIVPADNPANLRDLRDLAREGLALVLAAEGSPVRDYTNRLLERLAVPYGEDYPRAVLANLVSEEGNVRQVTAKVALGEADAGIVYVSDVTPDIAEQVRLIPIPDLFNAYAFFPIATLRESEQSDLARAFIAFVLSDAGQAILAKWNFIPLRPSAGN
jgi:molybdate transport system substrate-binding protein